MFELKSIKSLSTFISRGVSPKYRQTGYSVINQRCIRNNLIDFSVSRFTEKEKKFNKEKFIKKWDVLVNSTGVGTLGRVAQCKNEIDNATIDSHITLVRPNLSKVDGLYFGYAVIYIEDIIKTLGKGATGQTELSREILGNTEIPIPKNLQLQKKIALILSNYDELIYSNTTTIKILEKFANATYKKYFDNLSLHGNKKIKLKNVCSVISRGPSIQYKQNSKIPVLNQKCIRNGEIYLAKIKYAEKLTEKNKHLYLKKNDILVNSMGVGTLGRVSRNLSINNKLIIHNCITLIRTNPKILKAEYIYYFVKNFEEYFVKAAKGTTGQTSLDLDVVKNLSIIMPEKKIYEKYIGIMELIWMQIGVLKNKNDILNILKNLMLKILFLSEFAKKI